MANLDTLDRNDLYKEIADLARDQGVSDQPTWDELVDEVIDSHLEMGELNADQDLENVRTLLHEAWEEYKRESGPERPEAIDEDPTAPRP